MAQYSGKIWTLLNTIQSYQFFEEKYINSRRFNSHEEGCENGYGEEFGKSLLRLETELKNVLQEMNLPFVWILVV